MHHKLDDRETFTNIVHSTEGENIACYVMLRASSRNSGNVQRYNFAPHTEYTSERFRSITTEILAAVWLFSRLQMSTVWEADKLDREYRRYRYTGGTIEDAQAFNVAVGYSSAT